MHTFSLKRVSRPSLSCCCVMRVSRLHRVSQPMKIFRSEACPYINSSTRVLVLCYGFGGFLLSSVVLAVCPFISQLLQLCNYMIPSSAFREISSQCGSGKYLEKFHLKEKKEKTFHTAQKGSLKFKTPFNLKYRQNTVYLFLTEKKVKTIHNAFCCYYFYYYCCSQN